MIALTLTRDKVDAGVLIIHETTHAPVLVGETPTSQLLLDKYVQGERYVTLDKTRKKRVQRIPPLNFEKFMALGVEYFSKASFVLTQQPFSLSESIEVEGKRYMLRNINAK